MIDCTVCGGTRLERWADLGSQPLANALQLPGAGVLPHYPLSAVRCTDCGHAQLGHVVPPENRYRDYGFRSGVSATFRNHCDDVARTAQRWVPGARAVLDIGANDGTLLGAFHGRGFSHAQLVGVDCDPAPEAMYQVVRGAFPEAVLPRDGFDVVTTLNTLNAVTDLHAFVAGVAKVLSRRGVWCVEVPYLGDLLADLQFDTIYHEHVHYFLATPFRHLVREHDLEVLSVEHVPIHGGSLRFLVGRAKDFPGAAGIGPWTYFEERAGLLESRAFVRFQQNVDQAAENFRFLRRAMRGTWAGYGAAAKSTVICGVFGLGPSDLAYIVDETPAKQGKLSPYGIPVVPAEQLRSDPVSALVAFAWNYIGELEAKLRKAGFTTPLLYPVPPGAPRMAA